MGSFLGQKIIPFLFFSLIFLLLLFFNSLLTEEEIPFVQIIAATAIFGFYFYACTVLIGVCWTGIFRQRLFAILGYLLLAGTLFPVVKYVIHDLLPRFDIIFFDEELPYDELAFLARLVRDFVFITLFAFAAVAVEQWIKTRKIRSHLQKEKERFQHRLLLQRYNSHFLENMISSGFGDMLMGHGRMGRRQMSNCIELMSYFLRVDEGKDMVSWEEEMRLLDILAGLMDQYYGSGSVLLEKKSATSIHKLIPVGMLLFPLENCLKHATIRSDTPVRYKISDSPDGCVIYCQNWLKFEKDRKESLSSTGLQLLQHKFSQIGFPVHIEQATEDGHFHFKMYLNWGKGS